MNEKAKPTLGLDSLLHTAHAAHTEVESKLSALGLSMAKLFALRALLDAGEGLQLGQLAGRLSCVKSNITQLVDRLEADGFVARKTYAGDRRTKIAVLTAAGRKACKEGIRVQQEAEREILATLTRSEAQQLAKLLHRLALGMETRP